MHPDLPPFDRFLLAREHPRSAEIIAETDLFISKLEVTVFKSQAQRQKFLDDDLTSIITRGIPDGQYDKMLTMARANILYFIADDYFESTSEEKHTFIKDIKNIFKGHTASNESALARSFRDLYQTTAGASTGLEYQQYVRLSYQWLRSSEETADHTDIMAQLKWRRVDSGGYFFFAFARYAVGIYLSDEQLDDPLLAKCTDIGIDVCTMENDIVSYQKELDTPHHQK
ncbi:isoprenoid synthase domain-containing protein [Mycena leptocephala]|nr:isoprenoid synthase domain-containing protein [Mycena leptocephala]